MEKKRERQKKVKRKQLNLKEKSERECKKGCERAKVRKVTKEKKVE